MHLNAYNFAAGMFGIAGVGASLSPYTIVWFGVGAGCMLAAGALVYYGTR